MKNILLILFTLFTIQVNSQIVGNVQSKQSGNNILITYNLSNSDAGSKVKINAYYAVNEGFFIGPLQKVSGDVNEISSGNGEKAITWNVLEEINGLEGNVKFKIEAIPLKKQNNPIVNDKSYRGEIKEYVITSTGVIFSLFIANSESDNNVYLNVKNIRLIDNEGNQYIAKTISIQKDVEKNFLDVKLIKGIPFKVSIYFEGIEFENTNSFSVLEIKGYPNFASNYSVFNFQFRNFQL